MSSRFMRAVAALSFAAVVQVASGATVFETTDLVASTPTAAAQLPPPIEFSVPAAGTYVAGLSDLNVPAAFDALSAIVTHDLQVVARLEIPSGSSQAQASFVTTAAGTYRIHVLGTLPADQAGGIFALSVGPQGGGAPLVDTAGTIVADSSAPPTSTVLEAEFEIPVSGNYQLAVTDHAFPSALASAPQVLLSDASLNPVNQNPFAAVAGETYHLRVFATAAAGDAAGLYSARITGPASVVAYQSTNRVGKVLAPVDVSLPAAGQYLLTIGDANFPGPLTALAALVIQDGAVLGQRPGAGNVTITGAQGAAQLFAFARTTTVGALTMRLSQGASVVFGDVRAVDASPAADTPAIYSYEPDQAVAAGSYRLTLSDFRFPSALPSLHAAVIQGDSIIGSADQAGTLDVTLTSGKVQALVAVEPPPGTPSQPNSGLFGIDLSKTQGANVFESTQGVGGLFRSEPVQIPSAGSYEFTVADLQFPAALGSSALAITRGTDLVAQILGGSKVSRQLAAGTYILNFIGQPGTQQVHGTYGLRLADAPAAPTVMLTANPGTITSGERTTLTWSTANATSCTAGNGWSGGKNTSGSEQSAALNANATFELSCSGPGGSTSASASVVVNARSSNSGGGGGGSTSVLLLIYMSLLGAVRTASRFMIMSARRNVPVTQTH